MLLSSSAVRLGAATPVDHRLGRSRPAELGHLVPHQLERGLPRQHLDVRHHAGVLVLHEMAVVDELAGDDRVGERDDELGEAGLAVLA